MRNWRAYAAVVAAFAMFLYLALVVAAFGLISLATNTDVIADPDVGPIVGPIMTGCATLMLFVFLLVIGTRVPAEKQRISPGVALAVGFACYFVFIVAGGVVGAAGDPEQPFHYLLFAVGQLGSVYAITVGLAGFVVTVLFQLVLVGRFQQRGRPRWPWEKEKE